MLIPQIPPPFSLAWGFSTKLDDPGHLPPVMLSQVHGCSIVGAGAGIQEGDGLWTTQPGVRIGVRVADCVPILLAGFAHGAPWIAALHAGWRGAVGFGQASPGGGIFRQGLDLFRHQGGDISSLVWALGPCIQRCHFEVGGEVIQTTRQDPAWHEDLVAKGLHGKAHLDLPGLLRAQGLHAGLNPANEGSVALCTVCQDNLLWSYRRGDHSQRQWGWIEIV